MAKSEKSNSTEEGDLLLLDAEDFAMPPLFQFHENSKPPSGVGVKNFPLDLVWMVLRTSARFVMGTDGFFFGTA